RSGRLQRRPRRGRPGRLPPLLPSPPGKPALPVPLSRGRDAVRRAGRPAQPTDGGGRGAHGRTPVPTGAIEEASGGAGLTVRPGLLRRRLRGQLLLGLLVRATGRCLRRVAPRGVLRRRLTSSWIVDRPGVERR